jgi:hypothetical protein
MDLVDAAVSILCLAVSGLVKWVWNVQSKLTDLQVSVARDFHTKAEIREVMADLLRPLKEGLDDIKSELRKDR